MQIGPAVPSDLPELIQMLCLAYNRDLDSRFRAHVYEDCTYQLHQSRVGKADGKIVSYVRISDRPIRIGRCVVRMGGVGSVSTHPEYRGRGYNSLVLQDAIRYMEQQGYDLSMLFTGISAHYGKLGWATFPEHSISVSPVLEPGATGQRTQPPFRLKESSLGETGPCTVRPFVEAQDLESVMDIYTQHNRERTGTLVRSPEYWRCGHSRRLGVLPNLVAKRQGRCVGYLKYGVSGQTVQVPEAGYLPDHAEAVWAMARAILDRAVSAGAAQIQFRLGRLHPLPEVLCQISNGRMTHTQTEGMMLRLIRLPSLLRKIAPELRSRLRRSGFSKPRASVAFCVGEHRATLRIEDGKIRVEDGARARVRLATGMRPMMRMLLGDATFGQMAALHRAQGAPASPRLTALLDALFPPSDPVYWGCDHF